MKTITSLMINIKSIEELMNKRSFSIQSPFKIQWCSRQFFMGLEVLILNYDMNRGSIVIKLLKIPTNTLSKPSKKFKEGQVKFPKQPWLGRDRAENYRSYRQLLTYEASTNDGLFLQPSISLQAQKWQLKIPRKSIHPHPLPSGLRLTYQASIAFRMWDCYGQSLPLNFVLHKDPLVCLWGFFIRSFEPKYTHTTC